MSTSNANSETVAALQSQIDRVLAGDVSIGGKPEDRRPFTAFMPDDVRQAVDLATDWMSIANKGGGVNGLAEAVGAISESLGRYRPGLVEHATMLFLTHYPEARSHLVVRSLEERQPNLVA